jgi:hypothetical protein
MIAGANLNKRSLNYSEVFPEHLRIGTNAPNERVPLASSDNKTYASARALGKMVNYRYF